MSQLGSGPALVANPSLLSHSFALIRLCSDLLRQRCGSNFNSPRQCCSGNGRGDFQHAILILGSELVGVHAFGQREGALELPVRNLLVQEIHLLRAMAHFALAANCERVPQRLDLHFLGVDARKRDTTVILLTVIINERLDCRSECGRRVRGSFATERPSAHHAIKDLIKIPPEIEQILKETIAALAATRPTEEEIIFQRSQHFFDELEGFQWRAPEWPAARRIVSRGVSHWSCAEWPDPTGYWPAEIRESSVVLGPAKRDRLRFRRLQQARETFRAMIRCLHQDDSGGQVCGRQTESFRRPNYREHTALRNSSWPHRASQGPRQL